MELSYQEVYTMNKTQARRKLVQTYQETGSIAQTARQWHTSRQVVRKWVRRWQKEGLAGLGDRSHRPQRFCGKLWLSPNPGAKMVRFPLGRKGYNGRVERSHRTDDEEFYLPLLLGRRDERELLRRAAQWLYYYVERPGRGMEGVSPWLRLRELGVKVPKEFALLPPIVLDRISTDWVLGPGNDLLTHYRNRCVSDNDNSSMFQRATLASRVKRWA